MLTYALIMVQNYLAALKREEGQGMAEYGLILALVALAVIGGFVFLGEEISEVIDSIVEGFTP